MWTRLFGPSAGSDATAGYAFMLANVARAVFGLGTVLAIIGLARRERYLLISWVGFIMGEGPVAQETRERVCRQRPKHKFGRRRRRTCGKSRE